MNTNRFASEAEKFINQQPEVWDLFVGFTLEAIASGRKHFGAKAIWERLRWETDIVAGYDDYKMNNNYHAYFAIRFEKQFPKYKGFFRHRKVGTI